MSNNERILKEDMILQCQEAFTQLDHNNSGLVGTKDLGNLLRALGINPTNEELQVNLNYQQPVVFFLISLSLLFKSLYITYFEFFSYWIFTGYDYPNWPECDRISKITGFIGYDVANHFGEKLWRANWGCLQVRPDVWSWSEDVIPWMRPINLNYKFCLDLSTVKNQMMLTFNIFF